MQSLSEYIKDLKKGLKIQKNEELAKQLNIDEQTVSRWCNGEEIPDDDTCIRLAFIAGDDPAKVLILRYLSSASIMSSAFWETISIKYRYGWTLPKSRNIGSRYDRRHRDIQITGTDRRSLDDRRRGLDRRLPLAS
jgi:transcriptional regulator with XRE-family HTH domain